MPAPSFPSSGVNPLSIPLDLPDLWQQEAVHALRDGKDVVVHAPTGAGKTRIFELYREDIAKKGQTIYTVPTRALANDKHAEWKAAGLDIGIATGDLAENTSAPIVIATLETQREKFLLGEGPALLVVDEYQLISDGSRGLNYELCIALADPEKTQLLLLSGSVENPHDIVTWLTRLNRDTHLISTQERPVPLDHISSDDMPYSAPKSITGFWPRIAVDTLVSEYGPLLIFAPRRIAAEAIATKIAAALPPSQIPSLSPEQQRACGKDLPALLEKGVAFHHSGLSYGARAGVIEPLAKAGLLRVIVATTGLSAGINFSVRSVIVTERDYLDRNGSRRELQPDELLQMFGRAGRRGLDSIGYAIATRTSPSLHEASPKKIRRANRIDWPTLLRVMAAAADEGRSPFEAARSLCQYLFSEQRIRIGFNQTDYDAPPAQDIIQSEPALAIPGPNEPLFGLAPTREEIYNSNCVWEDKNRARVVQIPLELATIFFRNSLRPALLVFEFVATTFPHGRVCRLKHEEGGHYYGKEIALGYKLENGRYTLTKNIRRFLGVEKQETFTYDGLEGNILAKLQEHYFMNGRVVDIGEVKGVFRVRLDFSKTPTEVYEDESGVYLVDPEERTVAVHHDTTLIDHFAGDKSTHQAAKDSPAFAWRALGLIDSSGKPTPRGTIFSFFQGGEGLAIAAALEDPTYHPGEIVADIANLRAGSRFDEFLHGGDPGAGSDRLALICRNTYGTVSHEGYLTFGLPPNYGDGAAEAIAETIQRGGIATGLAGKMQGIGAGDIERVLTEWLSLLRHIVSAPFCDWDRWELLQRTAQEALTAYASYSPTSRIHRFPPGTLENFTQHPVQFSSHPQ